MAQAHIILDALGELQPRRTVTSVPRRTEGDQLPRVHVDTLKTRGWRQLGL